MEQIPVVQLSSPEKQYQRSIKKVNLCSQFLNLSPESLECFVLCWEALAEFGVWLPHWLKERGRCWLALSWVGLKSRVTANDKVSCISDVHIVSNSRQVHSDKIFLVSPLPREDDQVMVSSCFHCLLHTDHLTWLSIVAMTRGVKINFT